KSYAAPEVKRACTRWLELCQEMKNIRDEERFAALRGKWVFCLVEGDLKTAEHVARECWNIARASGKSSLLVEAHMGLGVTQLSVGKVVQARKELNKSLEHYRAKHHFNAFLYT